MSTAAGSGLIGALALGWALILFYKKHRHRQPPSRFQVFLMLVAGFFLSGGLVGTVVETAGHAAKAQGANLAGQVFGVGTPLVLAFFACVWIVHDWKTKDIETATPWIALVTPMMLPISAGIGAYFAGAAAPAVTTIQAFFGG